MFVNRVCKSNLKRRTTKDCINKNKNETQMCDSNFVAFGAERCISVEPLKNGYIGYLIVFITLLKSWRRGIGGIDKIKMYDNILNIIIE